MNGIELTNRLISDIEQSLEVRNSVPDVITQIKQTNEGKNDLGDFVGAVNAISFDAYLANVVDLINFNEKIIDFNKQDIANTLDQIIEHRERIAHGFQELLDNQDIVSIDGFNNVEPLNAILLERLEDLHASSGKFLP